jgi:diguanylate cyclase (GGDEF)-like protein/PAS domain S-box-containing protein
MNQSPTDTTWVRDDLLRPLLHRVAGPATVIATMGAIGALVAVVRLRDRQPVLASMIILVTVAALVLAVVVPARTRLLRRQAAAIARRVAISDVTVFAAERLLVPRDLELGIADVLERLGRATDAARVAVYENSRAADGALLMSIRREWITAGIEPAIDDPESFGYPYAAGFSRWERDLGRGACVQERVSGSAGAGFRTLRNQGLSIAVVPIFVSGAWWGFLAVGDVRDERVWSDVELEALKVAAATLGAAMTREHATRALEGAEDRFRVLVEHSPVVIYIDELDETASTVYMSPQIGAMTGYTVEEWQADRGLWPKLLHPEDRERALALTARHNESGEPFRMDYRLIARNGRTVWIRDEAVMVRDEAGNFLYSQGIMQDVTEAKEAEERIRFLAYHDGLTGLPNQEMFRQLVELALARANRSGLALAVLCLDVDGFKLANDTLGTEGGDDLLRSIVERLGTTIRETDTLARRSGDEFLILLADLERGEVGEMGAPLLFSETVAGRIREEFSRPFTIDVSDVFVTMSIGISVFPDDATDVQTLLVNSETAMLASKQIGPGGFAAADVGTIDSATKFAFVQKLRRAVEHDDWLLHYQPIVELATGAIKGVEALVRWRTSDGEIIPPNEFIPLAEELGLIEAIGDWVVSEIVRQGERWRADGFELEMGFNLSPRQFWQPDLAERILSRLEAPRSDPTRIVVEITETSAMRDPDRAHDVLWDLHARGLRVAIDDFGTGYSSLSRLRSLPVDVLKIDRSFVSKVDEDRQAAQIVAAFIQLGQGLGMSTLAEGIETEGERRFLAEQGCELGQGYYFCRPMPADALSERFRTGDLVLAS